MVELPALVLAGLQAARVQEAGRALVVCGSSGQARCSGTEDSPDLLFSGSQAPIATLATDSRSIHRCTLADRIRGKSDQPAVRDSRRKTLRPIRSSPCRNHHSRTPTRERKGLHAKTRHVHRRIDGSETVARSLQEDRLVTASKDRERKAKTRLDPTPMAHP